VLSLLTLTAVVAAFLLYDFVSCTGVELVPALHEIAMRCAQRLSQHLSGYRGDSDGPQGMLSSDVNAPAGVDAEHSAARHSSDSAASTNTDSQPAVGASVMREAVPCKAPSLSSDVHTAAAPAVDEVKVDTDPVSAVSRYRLQVQHTSTAASMAPEYRSLELISADMFNVDWR